MNEFNLIFARATLALFVAASLGACGGSGGGGDSSPRPVAPPPVTYAYTPTAEVVDVVACTAPGQPVAACTSAASEVVVRDPAEAIGTPTSAAAQWLEISFTSTPSGGPAQSWTVSAAQDWLTIDPASGTATAGDPTRVALTAACPVAGARTADLSLALGGQTVAVPWAVSCRPGVLTISAIEVYQGPLTRVWAGPEAGWRLRTPPPLPVRIQPHRDIAGNFAGGLGFRRVREPTVSAAVEAPMLEIGERPTLLVVRVAHESPETPALRVAVEGADGGLLAEWLPGDAHIEHHHTLPPGEIAPCEADAAPHPWCLGAGDPAELPGSEYRPEGLAPRDATMRESEYRVELAGAVLCTGAAEPHVNCTADGLILDGLWQVGHSVRVVADPHDAIGKDSGSTWDFRFPVGYEATWRTVDGADAFGPWSGDGVVFGPWPEALAGSYTISLPVDLPPVHLALVPLTTPGGTPEFERTDIDEYLLFTRRWLPIARHYVRVTPALVAATAPPLAADVPAAPGFVVTEDNAQLLLSKVGRFRASDEGRRADDEVYAGIALPSGIAGGHAAPPGAGFARVHYYTHVFADRPYSWVGDRLDPTVLAGSWSTSNSTSRHTIAHEIGHVLGLLYHAPCTGSGQPHPYWPGGDEYFDARTGPDRLYQFGDSARVGTQPSDRRGFVHWEGSSPRERAGDLLAYGCGTIEVLSDWHYNLSALWRVSHAGLLWPPSPAYIPGPFDRRPPAPVQ